jgi:hypothetical protein
MFLSVLAIAFIPVWTKWWRAVVMRGRRATAGNVVAVVFLSLATLIVFQIGPWAVMGAMHGLLSQTVTLQELPIAIAIVFGPSIVVQIAYAINAALREA